MRIALILMVLQALLVVPVVSEAQPMGMGGMRGGGPYGSFCPGPRWGGPYGARRIVSSADDARQIIQTFFSSRGQEVRVGKIEERRWYFQAEVLDPKGELVDLVVIDKRTGRLRSIY
jgi:hypothetical protein